MRTFQRSEDSKGTPLRQAKARAAAEVAAITDAVRRKYVPAIAGQELTYQEKEAQALAFLAAEPEPQEAGEVYTFIFAEVAITAQTPRGVAEAILEQAAAFRSQIGPQIERQRLIAGRAIQDAATVDEAGAAVEQLEAALKESGL